MHKFNKTAFTKHVTYTYGHKTYYMYKTNMTRLPIYYALIIVYTCI